MSLLRRLAFSLFLTTLLVSTLGGPNDWVNIDYVILQAKGERHSATLDAEATIVRNADNSAGKGPWSVTNSKDILPPSKDPHDYLSWAPYHWPNCNWCTPAGRTHLAHTVDGPGQNDSNSSSSSSATSVPDPGDAYGSESVMFLARRGGHRVRRLYSSRLNIDIASGDLPTSKPLSDPNDDPTPQLSTLLPTNVPVTDTTFLSAPTPIITPTSDGRSHGPAQAAAKTTKASCTPSPTKSLAPSATWTTCPYVGRDGQVNPDVRTLNGPDAINDAAQAVLYNAIAYALKRSSTYSKTAANLIETFFLSPATKMNPNLNFGQIVRGPGPDGVTGTFTGVLDLRGIVKIVNGISIVKAAGSPDWTQDLDQAMVSWLSTYSDWLATSAIGRTTATRPNNHATFYVSQVASTKFLSGDQQGAIVELQNFCATVFLDQVARSGEQPFEAVRTRPYHYRNFNLEALITNAKLGDQLGINLWTCKSKYGATIQTALDFLLATDPRNEDVGEIFPHVASVAAAYGDPNGKYAAFLSEKDPNYQSKPYWFYDQTSALTNSPASKNEPRSIIWRREDSPDPVEVNVPFECPAVFRDAVQVEIDNGLFVTCDELRPFYA
ncbi:alginate lyase-domain-containing protein [Flammula alnicola]|nr:alginate lyase-domain-containing protein [Flammula alnicola]